jgi:hypothetical protein
MHLAKKDVIATALVAVAVVLYLLRLADSVPPVLSDLRATGLAILALGFVASAAAVVPGFDTLMHGNKVYLVATSLLGLVALAAGVVMLASSSEAALAVLMAAMVVLWGVATEHHTQLARSQPGPVRHAALTG